MRNRVSGSSQLTIVPISTSCYTSHLTHPGFRDGLDQPSVSYSQEVPFSRAMSYIALTSDNNTILQWSLLDETLRAIRGNGDNAHSEHFLSL